MYAENKPYRPRLSMRMRFFGPPQAAQDGGELPPTPPSSHLSSEDRESLDQLIHAAVWFAKKRGAFVYLATAMEAEMERASHE